jgi:predicted DNA-binding WGR domain protein
MNAVHLHRTDPARNMRRFYRLDVQPDLFGGFASSKNGAASVRAAGAWLANGT